jgi:hypothetical protein
LSLLATYDRFLVAAMSSASPLVHDVPCACSCARPDQRAFLASDQRAANGTNCCPDSNDFTLAVAMPVRAAVCITVNRNT